MSEQKYEDNRILVPAAPCDLATASSANPLVSRGLTDVTTIRLLKDYERNSLESNSCKLHLDRGAGWFFKEDYDKAIADFNAAIRQDPRKIPAYNLRGLAWSYKREYDRAIADFCTAILLFPSYAMFFVNRGNAWREKQDLDMAITDFNEAMRLDRSLAQAYIGRAKAWCGKRQYDNANRDFDEAIQLTPNNDAFFVARARFWLEMKDYDKAIRDLDQAVRLDHNNDAYILHGLARLLKGDYDDALRALEKAASRNPDASSACWSDAIACAEEHELRGQKVNALKARLYHNRALAWLEKEVYTEVVKDLNESIRLDPDNVDYYDELAWLLATCPEVKVRDRERAKELAMKACQLTNSSDESMSLLGAAFAEPHHFEELDHRSRWSKWFHVRLALYKRKQPAPTKK